MSDDDEKAYIIRGFYALEDSTAETGGSDDPDETATYARAYATVTLMDEYVETVKPNIAQAGTNYDFQYLNGYDPSSGELSLFTDTWDSQNFVEYHMPTGPCQNNSNCKNRLNSGIAIIIQHEDDQLSAIPTDRIRNVFPIGNTAISVSNTTNGAGYHTFECDLNSNILITTSDGVEYCMPIDIACGPGPHGELPLLTMEHRTMAGYYGEVGTAIGPGDY